jgi:DNA-binding transcriptional LysR family regulator
VLTDFGQSVFRYADEIFSVGQELQNSIRGQPSGRPIRFVVGMPDVLPKLIAYRLKSAASIVFAQSASCRAFTSITMPFRWSGG